MIKDFVNNIKSYPLDENMYLFKEIYYIKSANRLRVRQTDGLW